MSADDALRGGDLVRSFTPAAGLSGRAPPYHARVRDSHLADDWDVEGRFAPFRSLG